MDVSLSVCSYIEEGNINIGRGISCVIASNEYVFHCIVVFSDRGSYWKTKETHWISS